MLAVVESRSVLEKNALESELSADLFLYMLSRNINIKRLTENLHLG